MAIHISNSNDTRILSTSNYSFSMTAHQQTGIILFINYTKGDETELVISYSMRRKDDPDPNAQYNLIYNNASGMLASFSSTINTSNYFVYPIAIEFPVDEVTVNFSFTNSSTNEGSAVIFAKVNNPYV